MIDFNFRLDEPKGAHTSVRVFVKGALAGTLTLRNEEVHQLTHEGARVIVFEPDA